MTCGVGKGASFQIKEMTETLVETQNQLEKVTRDKISLLTELQTARGQIGSLDADYGQVRANVGVQYVVNLRPSVSGSFP